MTRYLIPLLLLVLVVLGLFLSPKVHAGVIGQTNVCYPTVQNYLGATFSSMYTWTYAGGVEYLTQVTSINESANQFTRQQGHRPWGFGTFVSDGTTTVTLTSCSTPNVGTQLAVHDSDMLSLSLGFCLALLFGIGLLAGIMVI